MSAIIHRVTIGFGSESGNARALAEQLAHAPFLQNYTPTLLALNDIKLTELTPHCALLIISSNFGDGEPPGNAEKFLTHAMQCTDLQHVNYAIFGLGDTAYPQFCGFTKQLAQLLEEKQANPIINRVDADACYPDFFQQWLRALEKVLAGDALAGQQLSLQVTAYAQESAFEASIVQRYPLSRSTPAAHHLRLDVRNSGMAWRAGDTLYVVPENEDALLTAIGQWYGLPEAIHHLRTKELRHISKAILRDIQQICGNEALKSLLKYSQRQALETYLWGADILDILQDFCTPDNMPLGALCQCLPSCLPRAYSIASHAASPYIDLCIRDVSYTRNHRSRHGTATQWLLHTPNKVRVYCRSNPQFHLLKDPQIPIILIGTGTGIAPLMGLLREMQAKQQHHKTCLIFGERKSTHDYLYKNELQSLQKECFISELITAFSQDNAHKYYVQDALIAHASLIGNMLDQGAHLYICGNKKHLEKAVSQAINAIHHHPPSCLQTNDSWQQLMQDGRIHSELY